MMKLNANDWESFRLSEIFDFELGRPIHNSEIEDLDDANKYISDKTIPYVTRTAGNNGIERILYLSQLKSFNSKINNGNCITVGAEGFTAYYQPFNFINGNKVNILRHPK